MSPSHPDPKVNAYIAGFPDEVRARLEAVREVIRRAAPDAEEAIAYGMPAFRMRKKPLVYFAGYAAHIGLYATPTGHEAFRDALAGYKQGKGSVQFPHERPLPLDLIERMVRWRVGEGG